MSNERKNIPIRKLCITGLMMALSVVIGIVCKNLFTWAIYYRVTFENFPIILTGFCFGPVWGMAAGFGADAVSCLLSTNPAINPVISAGAAMVGLLSGLVPIILKRMKTASLKYALGLSVSSAHLFGQVVIKSIGKMFYYGMPYYGIFIGLAISVCVGTAEFFFILLLLKNSEIKKVLRGMTIYEL